MKNIVLIIGIVSMLGAVYFTFAQTDVEPPTIISVIPPSPPQSIDLDTLVYQDYPSTAPIGIGSVDLGEVIQSVVIDLGSSHQIFSVTLGYKPEATGQNEVVVQVSSTYDFAEYINIPYNSSVSISNSRYFKTNGQQGRYIRLLSNNDSSIKINDYIKVNICRL